MREMKVSGIEWIGEIPKEWEIVPHKYLMSKVKELCFEYKNENILSLTKQGVIVRDLVNPSGKMPTSFDGYQKVYPNNLLLCLFDIDVTPRCVGLIKDFGLTSPAYSQFILKKDALPEYYNYLLLMMDENKAMLHLSKNLRSSLTETDFGSIKSIKPSIYEQQRIVNYLDQKITFIDNIIEKTKESIEEYKKLKQSIITEIVTKGLNPDVKMKDSGIEWIGEIPEHWIITKAKYISDYYNGAEHESILDGDGDFVLVNARFVSTDSVKYQLCKAQRFPLFKGDICIVLSDLPNGRALARTFNIDEDNKYTLNQRVGCYRSIKINELYFSYFMNRNTYFINFDDGFNQTNLKLSAMLNIPIVFPPREEQEEIVNYLNLKCNMIDEFIRNKEILISELGNYKKSLIYEVVTGKKEIPTQEVGTLGL